MLVSFRSGGLFIICWWDFVYRFADRQCTSGLVWISMLGGRVLRLVCGATRGGVICRFGGCYRCCGGMGKHLVSTLGFINKK